MNKKYPCFLFQFTVYFDSHKTLYLYCRNYRSFFQFIHTNSRMRYENFFILIFNEKWIWKFFVRSATLAFTPYFFNHSQGKPGVFETMIRFQGYRLILGMFKKHAAWMTHLKAPCFHTPGGRKSKSAKPVACVSTY